MSVPLVLLIVNVSGRNHGFKDIPGSNFAYHYASFPNGTRTVHSLATKEELTLSWSIKKVNVHFSRSVIFDSRCVTDSFKVQTNLNIRINWKALRQWTRLFRSMRWNFLLTSLKGLLALVQFLFCAHTSHFSVWNELFSAGNSPAVKITI